MRERRRRLPASLVAGLAILGALLVLGLGASRLAPRGPHEIDLRGAIAPPSADAWMGTDALGRDVAARLFHGSRVSLGVGLLTALVTLAVGVPVGAAAGYLGGWWDAAAGRAIEALLCFPSLVLLLAVLSDPGLLASLPYTARIAVVLGITGWAPTARFLRAEFLKIKRSDQAAAARALGAGRLRVMARHILPRAAAPVLVTAAFGVGAAISIEAALAFLGFGGGGAVSSWGAMLNEAREHVHRAWWLALFPGAAVFAATLGCNLLGEGLRRLLDPRAADR